MTTKPQKIVPGYYNHTLQKHYSYNINMQRAHLLLRNEHRNGVLQGPELKDGHIHDFLTYMLQVAT